jgi:hypothetical protein
MTEITEETPRPIRKDKGKGPEKDVALDAPTLEMNLSKHPYYQKEGLDNPFEVKIGSWEDFKKLIISKKEGPKLFAFLARMIQNDEDMFSQLFSSENRVKR